VKSIHDLFVRIEILDFLINYVFQFQITRTLLIKRNSFPPLLSNYVS
jgi:hypothetical protein